MVKPRIIRTTEMVIFNTYLLDCYIYQTPISHVIL